MKAHRHTLGHEHDFEPQYGLPEALPADEKLLWQGSPLARAVALEVFHVRKLAIYFALLIALRALFLWDDGAGFADIGAALLWPLVLAALCLAGFSFLARRTAETTVYTITSKRVVMRIGIVLNVTYNLPFKRIVAAGMHRHADGHGDIPLALQRGERIAILQLWPHARPWRLRQPEPMLRCVPDVAAVAAVLSAAWSAVNGMAAVPANEPRRPAAPVLTPSPAGGRGLG
jgi:hypothetical protein